MSENNGKVVYLAGPYSGDTAEHKRQARLAASDLRKRGFAVIVPHLESEKCEAALNEIEWVAHGLQLLKVSHFIAVFGDWRKSAGTLMELNNAAIWGIPLVAVYDRTGRALFCCSGAEIPASEYKKNLAGRPNLEKEFGKVRLETPGPSGEVFEHQLPEYLRGPKKKPPFSTSRRRVPAPENSLDGIARKWAPVPGEELAGEYSDGSIWGGADYEGE